MRMSTFFKCINRDVVNEVKCHITGKLCISQCSNLLFSYSIDAPFLSIRIALKLSVSVGFFVFAMCTGENEKICKADHF